MNLKIRGRGSPKYWSSGERPAARRGRAMILCADDSIYRRGLGVTRGNFLYLVIGALTIAVAVMGYQLYQDRHQPEGLHINVGPGGLSIQGK